MVVYDLRDSPYTLTRGKLKFHFSSQYNVTRFLSKEELEIANISASLSNRFKYQIKAESIARISLYRKIERRGFYILQEGKPFKWLET